MPHFATFAFNYSIESAMPELLQQIEDILSFKLNLAPERDGGPLASLMPFKENCPKYAVDGAGHIVGLNLGRTGLTDERWGEIMGVEGLVAHLRALNLS